MCFFNTEDVSSSEDAASSSMSWPVSPAPELLLVASGVTFGRYPYTSESWSKYAHVFGSVPVNRRNISIETTGVL